MQTYTRSRCSACLGGVTSLYCYVVPAAQVGCGLPDLLLVCLQGACKGMLPNGGPLIDAHAHVSRESLPLCPRLSRDMPRLYMYMTTTANLCPVLHDLCKDIEPWQ